MIFKNTVFGFLSFIEVPNNANKLLIRFWLILRFYVYNTTKDARYNEKKNRRSWFWLKLINGRLMKSA